LWLALWWVAVAYLLIKSTVLNHASAAQKTETSRPHDEDYEVRTGVVRANAVETEAALAAYLADN